MLFQEYPLVFMAGIGMLLTFMTGHLNLSSTADLKFNGIFSEYFVFPILVYLEVQKLATRDLMIKLYLLLFTTVVYQYYRFMKCLCIELCEFLNIRLLKVKPNTKME